MWFHHHHQQQQVFGAVCAHEIIIQKKNCKIKIYKKKWERQAYYYSRFWSFSHSLIHSPSLVWLFFFILRPMIGSLWLCLIVYHLYQFQNRCGLIILSSPPSSSMIMIVFNEKKKIFFGSLRIFINQQSNHDNNWWRWTSRNQKSKRLLYEYNRRRTNSIK